MVVKANKKCIYTVTCMYDIPWWVNDSKISKKEFNSHGGQRTFGWYSSLKAAKAAVEENHCDIHECAYKYAIIEKVSQGVYAGCMLPDEWWYKWDEDKYKPTSKPEELKRAFGWGIG